MLAILFILFSQDGSIVQPNELLLAESARSFGNGAVTWSVETFGEHAQVSHHRATFTESGEYESKDEYSFNGTSYSTRGLTYQGKFWQTLNDSSLKAYVFDEHEPVFDIRSAGMSALPEAASVADSVWGATRDKNRRPSHTIRQDGSRVLVETTWENQGDRTCYQRWLNPRCNWAVERTRLLRNGEQIAEARCDYREWGGAWFPETIRYYMTKFENGGRPWRILTVETARFNDPSIPQSLGPSDIGIEPGTNIAYAAKGESQPQLMGWNGSFMEDFRRVVGRIERGEIKKGDRYSQQLRDVPPPPVEDSLRRQAWAPNSWERYVANFIVRFGLNTEQQQKAWSFYRDAKSRADAFVLSHKRELDDILTGKEPFDFDESHRTERESDVVHRFKKALHRIFREQLAEKLEQLPTRAQRAAEGKAK